MPLAGRHASWRWLAVWLLAVNFCAWGQAAPASVAEVVFAQGVASAQRGADPARLLGKGSPLFEGDIVTTGRKAFAVVQFTDMTRMTLRPDTALQINQYSHGSEQESALLRRVRGGLRAVTGLIAKSRPDAYRIGTPTVTIGVRGTDFDARLCEQDCAAERQALGAKQTATSTAVAARLVLVNGRVTAESATGVVRTLAIGGAVYAGDTLQTGGNAAAVLAFRDDSRVTLQADTRFKVEDYRYEPQGAQPGNVLLRLVRGSLRAVTGLIARREPQAFRVATVTATIGVRGSGMDVSCEGRCADGNRAPSPPAAIPARGDGLFVHSWQGGLELQFDSQRLVINENSTAFFASGAPRPVLLNVMPDFLRDNPAPRPDRVPVDLENLFGASSDNQAAPGLYVLVRDGHVSLGVIDLGNGEAGYVDPDGKQVVRLLMPPPFLEFDRYPRPDQFDQRVQHIIELISEDRPGATRAGECEVR